MIGKYFSVIVILITTVICLLKLQYDYETYKHVTELLTSVNDTLSPTIFAGGVKVKMVYGIPLLLALVLSIIGYKKKNKYRKFALVFTLLILIYLMIPVGMLLAT